jgi:hypothetical protein
MLAYLVLITSKYMTEELEMQYSVLNFYLSRKVFYWIDTQVLRRSYLSLLTSETHREPFILIKKTKQSIGSISLSRPA